MDRWTKMGLWWRLARRGEAGAAQLGEEQVEREDATPASPSIRSENRAISKFFGEVPPKKAVYAPENVQDGGQTAMSTFQNTKYSNRFGSPFTSLFLGIEIAKISYDTKELF